MTGTTSLMTLGAVVLAVHLLAHHHLLVLIVLTSLAKVLVTVIEVTLLVHTTELFSTACRSSALSVVLTSARTAHLLTFPLQNLQLHYPTQFSVVLFLLTLTAAAVYRLLPDTRHCVLRDWSSGHTHNVATDAITYLTSKPWHVITNDY